MTPSKKGGRVGSLRNRSGSTCQRLRLDTLVRLRWLAITGQLLAVLITHYGLHFDLPLGGALAAISVSAWLNVGLRIGIRSLNGSRIEPLSSYSPTTSCNFRSFFT